MGPVIGLHLQMGGGKHRERLAQRPGRIGRKQRSDTLCGLHPD
jgi:hypothetical protein